ncbi:hypothetical protein [Nocardioides caricicola]|uniref:Uncharacterized protein n=1 Tax=Nocardioides caricicola TaxID=634770 RepID=A0ABW0MXV9_9ACTN
MRKTTAAAVALSTAALTFGISGTAHAEQYGIDDPDDTTHGVDVLSMTVRNGKSNVNVITTHDDLRRAPSSAAGGSIFIDTVKGDKGPEYVFVGGFFEGTDYTLLETEGFSQESYGEPVENGDYVMRIDYRNDEVRVRMSRAALGNPGAVRVVMRAAGPSGAVDWVSEKREFSPWISRG